MTKTDIVVLNMNTYSAYRLGVSNRNWQILKQLIGRDDVNRILAVDFPPIQPRQTLRAYLKDFRIPGQVIKKRPNSRLKQIDQKLFVYSTTTRINQKDKIRQQIQECLDILEFKDFFLWSYLPFLSNCIGKLGEKISVFDAVDNWIYHQSYADNPELVNQLKKDYATIREKADIIFTVSEDLLKLFPIRKNIFWIPNGVDFEHFSRETEIPKLFSYFQKPLIGYVGVIQNRVDIDILTEVARKFYQCSIILIGPTWPRYFKSLRPKSPEVARLEKYSNIYFLGPVSYQNLPDYLAAFDVAIIPHKKNEFTSSMDPLKLYEYLAAGKPVVTTPVAGVGKFGDIVKIANTKDEFCQKIKESFSLNTSTLAKQRRSSMRFHSWKNKVNDMFSRISSL